MRIQNVSIAARITLLFSVFVGALIAIIFLCLSLSLRVKLQDYSMESNTSFVKAQTASVSAMMEKLHWEAEVLSRDGELFSADRNKVPGIVRLRDKTFSPDVVGMLYIWPDGAYVSSAGAKGNVSDRQYFKEIFEGGEDFVVSEPVISKSLGIYIFVCAKAIKDHAGKVVAAAALQVPLSSISAEVAAIKIGAQGYGWMVNRDGLVLAFPDEQQAMNLNITDADRLGYTGLNAFSKKMLGTESGHGEWRDQKGRPMMSFYARIPATSDWVLGLTIPRSQAYSLIDTFNKAMGISLTVSLVLCVLLSLLLARSLSQPIRLAAKSFHDLSSGDADLTVRINMERKDEIGALASGFNIFINKLREIILNLKDAQGEVSRLGQDLGTNAEKTANAVSTIAERVDQARGKASSQSQSVTESSAAIEQITRNIESLDQLIRSESAAVTQASASIEEMVGNIASVTSSVEKMGVRFIALSSAAENGRQTQSSANEKILQINEQSRALLEANEVISSIASQTNLLAMNAAIEAAHAGEAGKGFSVVADEIRRLAETSAEQSHGIRQALASVQESISEVVNSSRESETAFRGVHSEIVETSAIVREVQDAMAEQREGSKQVLEALQSMNDITEKVREGSAEMRTGNQQVLGQIERLRLITGELKDALEEINGQAQAILDGTREVSRMAASTEGTIHRMDEAIGKFKV
jgi:methyl-accepting chemotaxis protein